VSERQRCSACPHAAVQNRPARQADDRPHQYLGNLVVVCDYLTEEWLTGTVWLVPPCHKKDKTAGNARFR
jgi:hypothetical protein